MRRGSLRYGLLWRDGGHSAVQPLEQSDVAVDRVRRAARSERPVPHGRWLGRLGLTGSAPAVLERLPDAGGLQLGLAVEQQAQGELARQRLTRYPGRQN